jgi:hypothetical protein
MPLKYVQPFTARLVDQNGKRLMTLLWGDPVHVLGTGDPVRVRARRREGFLPRDALADTGLLELYVIDVGQGDGVLMRTPDDRWHLIDAGIANEDQMTKKGAANFIRWKFIDDLQAPSVSFATVLVTHSDYDHYGGLVDVLSGQLRDGRTFGIAVEDFYHCGIGRFASAPKLGLEEQGRVPPLPIPGVGPGRDGSFITELLSGKTSFRTPARPFEQTFGAYARLVAKVAKRVRVSRTGTGSCRAMHRAKPTSRSRCWARSSKSSNRVARGFASSEVRASRATDTRSCSGSATATPGFCSRAI